MMMMMSAQADVCSIAEESHEIVALDASVDGLSVTPIAEIAEVEGVSATVDLWMEVTPWGMETVRSWLGASVNGQGLSLATTSDILTSCTTILRRGVHMRYPPSQIARLPSSFTRRAISRLSNLQVARPTDPMAMNH